MHSTFEEFRSCVERLAYREHETAFLKTGPNAWFVGPLPPMTALKTWEGIACLRQIWNQFPKFKALLTDNPQNALRDLEELLRQTLTSGHEISIAAKAICSCIAIHGDSETPNLGTTRCAAVRVSTNSEMAIQDVTGTVAPQVEPSSEVRIPDSEGPNHIVEERTSLLRAYKTDGMKRGVRITDKMIAKAARPTWNDRTPIQRWRRNDRRSTPGDDAAIRRVLKEQPHLKK